METEQLFIYQWHFEEIDNVTVIRIFGLNKSNESVYVSISDFTPYIYLELPENISWNQGKAQILCNYFDSNMTSNKALKKSLVFKKRLYYAHKEIDKDGNYKDKMFPYLFMSFSTPTDIKKFSYFIRKNLRIPGLGEMKFKIHESDANPILQMICVRNIQSCGWIKIKGKLIEGDEKESSCDKEFLVRYKNIELVESDSVPNPLIMGMDIEVNSSNPNTMPDVNRPPDKIFQIACVFARQGQSEDKWKKVLLSLGNPDHETTGNEVEIRSFKTEGDLLEGYTDLIQEKNPQIIVGYNIFMFDIPYMMDRAKLNYSFKFNMQGCLEGKQGKERMIKWSSSAYGTQEFKFLDCEGRLFVDLLPLIKRDYKFDTYSLKAVSTSFLGQTKDPLTHKGIFKCYRLFTPKSLGVCGKYCVQDSNLTVKLFEKLQYWVGLCEMAKTCNIPIFYTYTQGQQIKIFSQVYKKCMYDNYVVEKDGYIAKEDERYTGAYVFDPVPGLYDMIVSFDFSSLYPTTIIAYNIDYTTLVKDESIPDEKCNIFVWSDHAGCIHDKTVRKTKIKKEDMMCVERKFRFLKEPKGVIPTLLENLLGARKTTNKQISKLEEKLKTENLTDNEKAEIKSLITVLDKRQLAYKVSANSMYGAMGTRRGYLPFLPGAMCTTARGRQSIEKAAKHLQEVHKAHLVYGDSCTGDTPIILNVNNKIQLTTFDDFKEELWTEYRGFKDLDTYNLGKVSGDIPDSFKKPDQNYNLTNKGQINFENENFKIWTDKGWAKVNRIIRHHTDKKIYRVLTGNGCVDVTEDHSLLDSFGNQIKPKDCKVGTELLHSYPQFQIVNHLEYNHLIYKTEDKYKAQEKYIYFKSMGYNVSIDLNENYYLISATVEQLKEDGNKIKKIYLLHEKYNDYVYDIETEYGVFHAGIGSMIIKNTDSTYIHFDHINNARDLWNYALEVEQEVSTLFPRPMKLAFEEKIYWRYFILSKKRYMALKCDLDENVIKTKNKETGQLEDDIFKRGVLLARRDNSKFLQGLYKDLIMKIFYREDKNLVLNFVIDKINELFYYKFPCKSFVITKSVGDMEDYKIRPLPDDPKKRAKRLEELDCTEDEYRIKTLPAHIQLAEKMKRRGKKVDVGTRLEYLVTTNGGWDGKLFDKIEELEYFQEHSTILRVDFLYYLKNSINPIDEAILVAYGIEKFVERQYKLRVIKHKLCKKLEAAGMSRINWIK